MTQELGVGKGPDFRTGFSARLASIAILGVAAVGLSFLLPKSLRLQLFLSFSIPWAILVLLGVTVLSVLLVRRWFLSATPQQKLHFAIDLALAVSITSIISWQVPHRAFLENDESVYVAAADAIRFTFSPVVPIAGIYDGYGILHPTNLDLEKRGILYPLLIAALSSYSTATNDAAHLNLFAGTMLFLLFARMLRQLGSTSVAVVAGTLMLASWPIVSLILRSGMYDIVNAAFLSAMIVCLISWWVKPAFAKAVLVALLGACAAQVRYESLIPAAAAVLLIVTRQLRCPVNGVGAGGYSFLPLLLVPGAWRMALPIDLELPAAIQSGWGLEHFATNLAKLFGWLAMPSKSGNVLLSVLAPAGLVLILIRSWKRRRPARSLLPIAILLSALPLLLFSYWGNIEGTATSRYFIALMVAATIAVVSLLEHGVFGKRWIALSVLALSAGMFIYANQKSLTQLPPLSLPAHRDGVIVEMQRKYPRCNVLLVSAFPVMFTTRNLGAIFPHDWNELGPLANAWAPKMQIHAVVAASLQVPGMADNPGRLAPASLSPGMEWTLTDAAANTVFRELWRSPEPLVDCVRSTVRRGVDPVDLASAARLWESR